MISTSSHSVASSASGSQQEERVEVVMKPQQQHEEPNGGDSSTTLRSSSTSACSTASRKRVRFGEPHVSQVVDPPSTLTAEEKRAVWYTSKELHSKHQSDVDNYTNYLATKAKRHNSFLHPSSWTHQHHDHDDADLPRRASAPEPSSHITWRGLATKADTTKRTTKVQQIIQAVVAHHQQLREQGANNNNNNTPLLSDELRKLYQKRARADRIKAEELGLQDAKEALGKIEVVKDLLTHKHTTLNSPTRQLRKVSMLAKMGVNGAKGALGSISVKAI